MAPQSRDQRRKNCVDAGSKEHRGSHDEEVIKHEVDEIVGVLLCRKRSRDIADDFEDQPGGKGYPPPTASGDGLRCMDKEVKEEPCSSECSDFNGGRITVDNDATVIFPVGLARV